MDIGFMQFAPALGNVQATVDRIDKLGEFCAGVDLLVLPELCNSGYNFESQEQAWATSEEIGSGVFNTSSRCVCGSAATLSLA